VKCVNHPELDAAGVCVKCGRGVCAECKRELAGKTYCQICADVYSQIQPEAASAKCINHPELDAAGVCAKCGKSLCTDCKRELFNKTFCQPCAQEMLTKEADVAFTLANINKRKTNGNQNKPRYLNYLNIAAGCCLILGFVLTFLSPFICFPLLDSPDGEKTINNMVSIGITLAIAGVILTTVSIYFHLTTALNINKAKAGLLLGIVLVIFGAVYLGKHQEHTIPIHYPYPCPCGNEGCSFAVNNHSHCCPNGYPYYWSSDGICHTDPPPNSTPAPPYTPTPTATPTSTPTPTAIPSGPTYTLTVIYFHCCDTFRIQGVACPSTSWHCASGGGLVTPNWGIYHSGTSVTLTAIPASGYVFNYWGGDADSTSPTITIYMNSDKTVYAYFSEQ
jgi:hypothetical protein